MTYDSALITRQADIELESVTAVLQSDLEGSYCVLAAATFACSAMAQEQGKFLHTGRFYRAGCLSQAQCCANRRLPLIPV